MIIFHTAHLFEILSVKFCFPLKVLVTDYKQWFESLVRNHPEAGHWHSSWTWAICTWNLWINVQVCGLAPPVRGWSLHYITCFPPASSWCLWGYLCLCFGGFCPHSSPALNFLSLGFPRTLFSSVVNTAGGLAGSQRDLEISVMCDQGLSPSSVWSQAVQGRQGVLSSSWSSSVPG